MSLSALKKFFEISATVSVTVGVGRFIDSQPYLGGIGIGLGVVFLVAADTIKNHQEKQNSQASLPKRPARSRSEDEIREEFVKRMTDEFMKDLRGGKDAKGEVAVCCVSNSVDAKEVKPVPYLPVSIDDRPSRARAFVDRHIG